MKRMKRGAENGAIPYNGVLFPFQISENLKYQDLEDRFENLKSLEQERCK